MTDAVQTNQPGRRDRIGYIDFLKVIGLAGVIVAHTGPPEWVMMLRNFDVPLMVILSAMVTGDSYERHKRAGGGALSFYVARFKRIVFPTWIFLTLYFLVRLALSGQPYSAEYYLNSFLLTLYGIDYVWVMLIYLYSALLIPLFSRLKLSSRVMALVVLLYALYEAAYYLRIGDDVPLVENTFYQIIPYGALTWLGYNYPRMKEKHRTAILIGAAAVFVALGLLYWHLFGTPQNVQVAKKPPRLYYLSYGVMWAFALLGFFRRHQWPVFKHRFVRYISSHSIWIYLWHIVGMDLYDTLNLPQHWLVRFFAVSVFSMLMVIFVNLVLDVIERGRPRAALKYLRN